MERWRGLDRVPSGWGRCVVTIGVFDGVHRGHRHIIGAAVGRARELGVPCVVVTFDPHPGEVIRPGSHPPVLSGPRHKAQLLEELGVDVLCVLPFTLEFSRLSPDEFVHEVLVERLHAVVVIVGENFRFGRGAKGDVGVLRELGRRFGFAAEPVPLVAEDVQGEQTRLSSTYIRSCVQAGDVAAAAHALGRPHRLEGVVVRGDRRGRELGFPTANLETAPYAAIPADGVYAGWMSRATADGTQRWPAAISIGTNPTFDGTERRVEAYAIDAGHDLDLYGEHLALDFVARLRDTLRFDGVDALVTQIQADVDRAREILAGGPVVA